MTVLNFSTSPTEVFIVSDSSFSDPADMLPLGYCTKAYLLPHLEGIIAGTGGFQFIMDWFVRLNTSFVVRNMTDLIQFAPAVLREIHDEHQRRYGQNFTSTVYHWGYDRNEGTIINWAFRSTSNFRPERLPYGHAVKPATNIEGMPLQSFPRDYLAIVEQQKAEDEAKPVSDRVGVAGHLNPYMMRAITHDETGEVTVEMSTWRSRELSGYEAGFAHACSRLPSRS